MDGLLVLFEVAILKGEFRLLPLTPATLVVKIYICPLLVVICYFFWLLVPLKPGQILLVVPP